MGTPGQSWPFKPSATAQADYWNLDFTNQALTEEEKKQIIEKRKKQIKRQPVNTPQTVKRLEGDLFSQNGIRRLEKDFFAKNKKKSKPLNKSERIIKRIL